jgi:hypothetical protein
MNDSYLWKTLKHKSKIIHNHLEELNKNYLLPEITRNKGKRICSITVEF